jgi:hypothetical protein
MYRSAADTETAWIDAMDELYTLTASDGPYLVVFPDGSVLDDVQSCAGWLQKMAYRGDELSIRRYERKWPRYDGKDGRYEIHVKHWPHGAMPPDWPEETEDGFLLQPCTGDRQS